MLIRFKYKEQNGKWSELNMTKVSKAIGLEDHVIKCGRLKLLKTAVIFPSSDDRNILSNLNCIIYSIAAKHFSTAAIEFELDFVVDKKIFQIQGAENSISLWLTRLMANDELIFCVNKGSYEFGKGFSKEDVKFLQKYLMELKIKSVFSYFGILNQFSKNIYINDAYSWFSKNNIFFDESYGDNFLTEKANLRRNIANYDQVIKVTANTELLDLDLIRKDEIWFHSLEEKNPLCSLAEFKVREDLEIRRGYVQGRFGYLPKE